MANLKVNTVSGIGIEGTVFDGGLHFRSKNYLTLPKGTTTERTATSSGISTETGSIRYNTDSNKMECYIGDKWMIVSTSSPTLDGGARGIRAGGFPQSDRIEFFTISTAGNAIDFGNLTDGRWAMGSGSDRTRGVFGGGDSPNDVDTIDFITFSSTGDATDFGNLSANRRYTGGGANNTRTLFCGGANSSTQLNTIELVTTQSTGNATDFGDLTVARQSLTQSACSPTRTVIGGGDTPSTVNVIDFVTTASLGNAQDFGDKTAVGSYASGITSNATR